MRTSNFTATATAHYVTRWS